MSAKEREQKLLGDGKREQDGEDKMVRTDSEYKGCETRALTCYRRA